MEEIEEIIKKIIVSETLTNDVIKLTDYLNNYLKNCDDYEKKVVACRILDNTIESTFGLMYIIKNCGLGEKIREVNNNIKYDGKDIGRFVKHDNKIFKVNDIKNLPVDTYKNGVNYYNTENYVFDSDGNKYLTEECVALSKSEIRKYKIENLLHEF